MAKTAKETVIHGSRLVRAAGQPKNYGTFQVCGEEYSQTLLNALAEISFEAGKQEGRREVVETYKRENPDLYKKYEEWWSMKLKEWGIK